MYADLDAVAERNILLTCGDKVNALCWTDLGLSVACNDGFLYFHSFEDGGDNVSVKLCSPVHFVDTMKDYTIAGCIDGSVHFVTNHTDVKVNYSLKLKEKITALKLISVKDKLLAFIGTSDSQVKVFHVADEQFKYLFALEGHSNWISALAFDGADLLATGSHDKSIRLWRLHFEPPQESKKLKEFATMRNFAIFDSFYIRIELESVLLGPEDWVHSVSFDCKGRLLSGAGDGSVMLWQRVDSIWQSVFQVGQPAPSGGPLSSDLYDAALFTGSSGDAIVAHSSTGSFLKWEGDKLAQVKLSGHYKAVEDVCWSPDGAYLLSVSEDRTTRVFEFKGEEEMVEAARPQIHGYEMRSVVFLGEDRYISAADEKVIRLFQESQLFKAQRGKIANCGKRVVLPALGLSNKEEEGEVKRVSALTEIDLCRDTLWPELDKLYSHGDELYTLAVSPDGAFFASAAKASLAGDSAVRLWDAKSLKVLRKLPLHQLTVVQLAFSPDSRRLLSVSRDRTAVVYDIMGDTVVRTISAHTRIVWTGQWVSADQFITGGRNGQLYLWSLSAEKPLASFTFESGITASCTLPEEAFVGLENGFVFRIRLSTPNERAVRVAHFADTITRIVLNEKRNCVAIASRDHSIRVIFL